LVFPNFSISITDIDFFTKPFSLNLNPVTKPSIPFKYSLIDFFCFKKLIAKIPESNEILEK